MKTPDKSLLLVDESKEIIKDNSSLLKKLLRGIQRWITKITGYRVSKAIPFSQLQIDMRGQASDPIEAVYRAGSSMSSSPNKWVIIDVPTDRTRRFPMAFGVKGAHADPFAETAQNYLNGKDICYKGSVIQKYFDAWQPKNAAQLLGLDDNEAHKDLLTVPAYGAVCPWDFDSPQDRAQANSTSEWRLCGPITNELGQLEFRRFMHVADSIVNTGYHRNTDLVNCDIGAQVLVKGSDWRILICDGMHRYATLCALGWKEIPVSIRRWPMMIRREDVQSWPNVVNGFFSVDCALKVFDLFFEGNQPAKYEGFEKVGEKVCG